jgi:hypothetical protein
MTRDQKLIQLRPSIEAETVTSLSEEPFTYLTLRPILQLQQFLMVDLFTLYLKEKSIKLSAMSAFKQRLTIENAVKKDLPLRHTLMGCIIGHFTAEEYGAYISNRIAFHKRLTNLLIQQLSATFIKPEDMGT